jgi:hypothetical protein
MATVSELMNQLSQIEDKSQAIVFQYYLSDDFLVDGPNGQDTKPSQEIFIQAAELVDKYIWAGSWTDLASEISNLHNYEQSVAFKSTDKTCGCSDCKCEPKNKAVN